MRWPETPAEVRGGFPRVTIDGELNVHRPYNPEVFTLPAGVDPATVPELSTVLGFTLSPPDLGHTHSFFW